LEQVYLSACLLHSAASAVFEIDMPLLVVSQMGGSLTAMGLVAFLKRILYYSNDSSSCTEVGIEESDGGLTRVA
jgi:hypothetical protein